MSDNLEEPLENEAKTDETISSGIESAHSDCIAAEALEKEESTTSEESENLNALEMDIESEDTDPFIPETSANTYTRKRFSDFISDRIARQEDDEISFDFTDEENENDSYLQNRELSWLSFNERVLDQGADDTVPLLERLNFISIFSSNLQEFFMVRVGSLTDLATIDPPVRDTKTNMTAKQQLKAIYKRCRQLYPIQESIYEHVRGLLAQQGIRHLGPSDLSPDQISYLKDIVENSIEPFLSPQIINSRHPFPHLENEKLYILVRLDKKDESDRKKSKKQRDKDKSTKKDKGADDVLLGLIPLPHQCERVIRLPGPGLSFILLEHVIEMFAPEIFSMYKIKHTNVVRVTRSADIDAAEGSDELDDYREHMRRLLKKRDRLAPVRLECERQLSPITEALMLKKLKLKRYQTFNTQVPLSMEFVSDIVAMIDEKRRSALTYKPFTPAWPVCLERNRPIMEQVAEHETLLFYPYESMDPFVLLLREAASDPSVISIKITLYRLAHQSHLAEALIAAAESGKEVCALFELRARFDESNNIEWSQRFERAGCTVLYGFKDLKVHSKICCITRRLPNGDIQHITQLGTGNYNEKTARLYTDLCYITTNEEFARDGMEFFRNMQLENISDNYNILYVAPLQIKQMIIRELDKQIKLAQQGLPNGAFLKANSLTDKDVIDKIAEASQAGVAVTLLIRGICCLVPGVPEQTEEVRVVSLIGRLLEHSRIYCFGQGETSTIYLSSADLMTRNLDRRVEIAWPLLDPELKHRVLIYTSVCMHDTAKLRELRPNGTYTPLGTFTSLDQNNDPKPPYDSQAALIEEAALAASHAARESFQESVHETSLSADKDEFYSYSLYDEPASADDLSRPYATTDELSSEDMMVANEMLDQMDYELAQDQKDDSAIGFDDELTDEFTDYESNSIDEEDLDEFDSFDLRDKLDDRTTSDVRDDFEKLDDQDELDELELIDDLIANDLEYEAAIPTEISYAIPTALPAYQTGQIPPYVPTIPVVPYRLDTVVPYATGSLPPYQTGPAQAVDPYRISEYQTGQLPPYQQGAPTAYPHPMLQNIPSIQPSPAVPLQTYEYGSAPQTAPTMATQNSAETVIPLIPSGQVLPYNAPNASPLQNNQQPAVSSGQSFTQEHMRRQSACITPQRAPYGQNPSQRRAGELHPVQAHPQRHPVQPIPSQVPTQQGKNTSSFFEPHSQEIVMPPQKRGLFKKKKK